MHDDDDRVEVVEEEDPITACIVPTVADVRSCIECHDQEADSLVLAVRDVAGEYLDEEECKRLSDVLKGHKLISMYSGMVRNERGMVSRGLYLFPRQLEGLLLYDWLQQLTEEEDCPSSLNPTEVCDALHHEHVWDLRTMLEALSPLHVERLGIKGSVTRFIFERAYRDMRSKTEGIDVPLFVIPDPEDTETHLMLPVMYVSQGAIPDCMYFNEKRALQMGWCSTNEVKNSGIYVEDRQKKLEAERLEQQQLKEAQREQERASHKKKQSASKEKSWDANDAKSRAKRAEVQKVLQGKDQASKTKKRMEKGRQKDSEGSDSVEQDQDMSEQDKEAERIRLELLKEEETREQKEKNKEEKARKKQETRMKRLAEKEEERKQEERRQKALEAQNKKHKEEVDKLRREEHRRREDCINMEIEGRTKIRKLWQEWARNQEEAARKAIADLVTAEKSARSGFAEEERRTRQELGTSRKLALKFAGQVWELGTQEGLRRKETQGEEERNRAQLIASRREGVTQLKNLENGAEGEAKTRWQMSAEAQGGEDSRRLPYAEMVREGTAGMPRIVRTAWDGNVSELRLCLSTKSEVSKPDNLAWTPLHAAAYRGNEAVVQCLLDTSTNVNALNTKGETALHASSIKGFAAVTELLLAKNADPGLATSEGWTPLMYAAQSGHTEVCEHLIRAHPGGVRYCNEEGWSPLLAGALGGHTEVVKLLVARGAQVNARNVSGWTALLGACRSGKKACVLALCAANCDVHAKNYSGEGAATVAARSGHDEVLQLLTKSGCDLNQQSDEGWTPLLCAARNGSVACVNVLLRKKVSLETRNKKGWTALSVAAFHGKTEVVDRLLAAGADPDAASDADWTPMMLAAKEGHLEPIRLLRLGGAAIDAVNQKKWTAAMIATKGNHLDVVALLLTFGAQVDMANDHGWSCLFLAAQSGNEAMARLLVDQGRADVNLRSENGETPLHLAARNGFIDIVRYLIINGADVNALDNDGWTPLLNARKHGYSEMAVSLVKAGADAKGTQNTWNALCAGPGLAFPGPLENLGQLEQGPMGGQFFSVGDDSSMVDTGPSLNLEFSLGPIGNKPPPKRQQPQQQEQERQPKLNSGSDDRVDEVEEIVNSIYTTLQTKLEERGVPQNSPVSLLMRTTVAQFEMGLKGLRNRVKSEAHHLSRTTPPSPSMRMEEYIEASMKSMDSVLNKFKLERELLSEYEKYVVVQRDALAVLKELAPKQTTQISPPPPPNTDDSSPRADRPGFAWNDPCHDSGRDPSVVSLLSAAEQAHQKMQKFVPPMQSTEVAIEKTLTQQLLSRNTEHHDVLAQYLDMPGLQSTTNQEELLPRTQTERLPPIETEDLANFPTSASWPMVDDWNSPTDGNSPKTDFASLFDGLFRGGE